MFLRIIAVVMGLVNLVQTIDAQSPYRQWVRTSNDQKKLALVIDNSDYPGTNNDLPGARLDANLMTETLERQGYDVLRDRDLDQEEMDELLEDFGLVSEGYEQFIFYYAGHMFESDGVPYLAPVDMDIRSTQSARKSSVNVEQQILGRIADPSKPKLVVLDACRTRYRNFSVEEQEQVNRWANTMLLYSTVSDTRTRDDNQFTEELCAAIHQGGCISIVEREVRRRVYSSDPSQLINSENYLLDDICFVQNDSLGLNNSQNVENWSNSDAGSPSVESEELEYIVFIGSRFKGCIIEIDGIEWTVPTSRRMNLSFLSTKRSVVILTDCESGIERHVLSLNSETRRLIIN